MSDKCSFFEWADDKTFNKYSNYQSYNNNNNNKSYNNSSSSSTEILTDEEKDRRRHAAADAAETRSKKFNQGNIKISFLFILIYY
jgi:hypothetical protein